MWKRLQGSREKDKAKRIGKSTHVETTYDQDHLQKIPPISRNQHATYYPDYESPSAPSYYHDTLSSNNDDHNEYRASGVPTVSSYYSQPSPALQSDYHYADATQSDLEISPPSSPEPDQPRRNQGLSQRIRSMRDVSPMDEFQSRMAGQRNGTNIPVLRKAPPSLRSQEPTGPPKKFWGGKVAPNSKVRWDEYSGEPTSSNAGKSGQVNPGSYAKGAEVPPATSEKSPTGYRVSVTGGERTNLATTKPSPVNTTLEKPREPWKGASGRTEIIQPFKHQPATKSPTFFRKAEPSPKLDSAKDDSKPLPVNVATADTAPVADVREQLDTHENPIIPTVPLQVGRITPPRSIASPTSPSYPVNHKIASPTSLHSPGNTATHSLPTPTTPTTISYPATNTREAAKTDSSEEPSAPADTKVASKSVESTPRSTASKDNGQTSHFSWTTNNTSTTYQHSPSSSPPPPLPISTPVLDQEPLPVAPSILNRRRPVPTSDTLPVPKHVPATVTTSSRSMMRSSSDPPSPRPGSTFSTNTQKALPRPPTEISAADHVDILEAQIEDLRVRRSNVHRLLQDLYNAAPPNPLITDFRRMRLVEQRKKDFENELAEIRVEEHDVGLKLHRALRKRERGNPGSESAIWIRRVTR